MLGRWPVAIALSISRKIFILMRRIMTRLNTPKVHQLIPRVNLESKYDMKTVVETIYKDKSDYPISALGPGGGAFYNLGFCCEFMGSALYKMLDDKVVKTETACRYAYVDDEGLGHWKGQKDDDRFGLMGNFYLSQNQPGKVVKIRVKKRLSKENFTSAIRAVLLAKYGPTKPVSLGGVFLINSGVAKLHIMPKYWPKEPSTPEAVDKEWLKFYHITKHPLVCLSVFHSYDPGFDLRPEHTHCYNLDADDEAGHYHYDTTPDTIEYEGYFNAAERVYRLDGPVKN